MVFSAKCEDPQQLARQPGSSESVFAVKLMRSREERDKELINLRNAKDKLLPVAEFYGVGKIISPPPDLLAHSIGQLVMGWWVGLRGFLGLSAGARMG